MSKIDIHHAQGARLASMCLDGFTCIRLLCPSGVYLVKIRHLPTKLAKVDSSKEFIETAWGVGYSYASIDVGAPEWTYIDDIQQ